MSTPPLQADLDRLITLVAGRLTTTETAGFSARVQERLETRSRGWWTPILSLTVAACALVAVVVMSPPRLDLPTLPSGMQAAAADPHSTPTLGPIGIVTATRAGRAGTRRLRTPALPELSEEERRWRERALPALQPADPPVLNEFGPSPIELSVLNIDPIGHPGGGKD